MADIKQKFGTSNQTISITIASLANGSANASTAIDNSTNLYMDALVSLKVKSPASSTSSSGSVVLYAYGTADGGTTYTEGATGTLAGITLTSPTNARLLGVVNVVANGTTYIAGPFAVAAAFGGTLPEKWGVIMLNSTGGTLDSASGNHAMVYQGVYAQSV